MAGEKNWGVRQATAAPVGETYLQDPAATFLGNLDLTIQAVNAKIAAEQKRIAADAQAALDAARANSAASYAEAKGRAADSRQSLTGLIQQFHDIAAGRVKTAAEGEFEQQYQNAQAQAYSTMLGMEGVDPGEAARLRAQQQMQMAAMREQDQRVIREQITDQAKQQAAGLTGVLSEGDQATANLDALYKQGMSEVDWKEKTGQASLAWDQAANAYGNARTQAGNTLGDIGRDEAFWRRIGQIGAETGGTVAGYGDKSGWFTKKGGT